MTTEAEGTAGAKGNTRKGNRLSPSQREERLTRLLNLRRGGATFRQIQEALGYGSLGHVHRDFELIMKRTVRELPDHVRLLELDRLDTLVRVYMPMLTSPDTTPEQKIRAGDGLLRVMDRRAKMLGLDAPQKFDITTYLREFAAREGLPEEMVLQEVEGIVQRMGFA